MFISDKHKFIFVHIPKTGGVSIKNSFSEIDTNKRDPKDKTHITLKELSYNPEISLNKYFIFTIIRNPFSKILSTYHYYKNISKSFPPFFKLDTFKDFILSINSELYLKPTAHVIPQIDYISVEGIIRTNFIGRFENIQKDFASICKQLSLPEVVLSHDNRTNSSSSKNYYQKYYDNESKNIVENIFKKDLDFFNYCF